MSGSIVCSDSLCDIDTYLQCRQIVSLPFISSHMMPPDAVRDLITFSTNLSSNNESLLSHHTDITYLYIPAPTRCGIPIQFVDFSNISCPKTQQQSRAMINANNERNNNEHIILLLTTIPAPSTLSKQHWIWSDPLRGASVAVKQAFKEKQFSILIMEQINPIGGPPINLYK
jgi:hypothetical protein